MTTRPDQPERDDEAITLKDAAERFGFTVSTLRAEAGRGKLTIYKIGRRFYTTPADIRNMVVQCRVEQKGRDLTSIRSAGSGLSETDRISAARAALEETLLQLKRSSRNTSATSTVPSRPARR
jgi:hypothetical protein